MVFHRHEINHQLHGYEVILYMSPHTPLVEFAEEFGLTKDAENDINRVATSYVKKKFPTLNVKTIKVMMGGVLVTSIMFGAGMTQAYAEESGTENSQEIESTPSNLSNAATESNVRADESPNEASNQEDTAPASSLAEMEDVEDGQMNEPGLVPGDFFYFVETIAEKVQIAMTFDDTEKAELISRFANERIAEANALFESGNTEEAIVLLNEALENQELALDYVTVEEVDGTITTTGTSTPDDYVPLEGMDDETEEEYENGDASDHDSVQEVRDELQTQFSQNITALLLAMEKVDNPKAKEALAKNVEKAYARMEKKLGKMKNIEKQLATATSVDKEVENLREDIQTDEGEFKKAMDDVDVQETATGVVPAVPSRVEQGKTPILPTQAQKGVEKAQAAQQTGQQKQVEKRTITSDPSNETKAVPIQANEKAKGNNHSITKRNEKAEGNANIETIGNADVVSEEEVNSVPKGNKGNNGNNGNQGKGNGNGKP